MASNTARPPIRERPFWQGYFRSRYTILFYSLLLMLVMMPVVELLGLPQTGMKLLLGACLLAAVLPSATRRTRYLVIAGVLLIIAVRFAAERGLVPVNSGLVLALFGVIGLLAAVGALRFVMSSEKVDHETIYAALSTYMLAGIFFGLIYWSIEYLKPGSFSAPDPMTDASAIYYSFVTLGSLGYGDILPRSELTRGIAVFEVIGGQLFLVVMVARLVGLFAENKRSN